MSQPVSASQYTYIGTVGSVLVTARTGNLQRVVLPGTYIGTVMFYDSATAAGTAATNVLGTIGLPALLTPSNIEYGIQFKNGLVYTSTGTPNVVLVWD